jgi:hypothetical protein
MAQQYLNVNLRLPYWPTMAALLRLIAMCVENSVKWCLLHSWGWVIIHWALAPCCHTILWWVKDNVPITSYIILHILTLTMLVTRLIFLLYLYFFRRNLFCHQYVLSGILGLCIWRLILVCLCPEYSWILSLQK